MAETVPATIPPEFDRAKHLQGDLVKAYLQSLTDPAVRGGRRIGYAFVMANPIELLSAFDILPLYPEITSLNISYRGGAPALIALAEEDGYSTDACGYVKMGIAAAMDNVQTVLGPIPKPDVLLLSYSGCQIYIHWWEQLHYRTGAPIFVLDIPYLRDFDGRIPKHDVEYVAAQLWAFVGKLESLTGRRFDEGALKETVRRSAEAWDLWRRCLEMGKRRPTPFDAYFESIYYMAPITFARGSEACVAFYRILLDELERRAEAGVGPTAEERYRLVFEGVPNYPFFRRFWNLFREHNARGVASTYPKVAGMVDTGSFRLDPARPMESLAEYMIHAYCNWNMPMRTHLLERYVRDYAADGVVIHSIKSCRSFSMGQGDIREYLAKECDIPTLLIESDHVDPRYFSEAQTRNRVDAFFETLSVRGRS